MVSLGLGVQLLLGLVADLLLGRVGPEGGLVNGVERVLGECVAVVLHGHLVVGQQRLEMGNLLLVVLDALLGGLLVGIDFALGGLDLGIHLGRNLVLGVGHLQGIVLLLEGVDESGHRDQLLVVGPIDLGRALGVGQDGAHIDVRLGLEGAEAALLVGGHTLGKSGPVDRGLGDAAGGHSAQELEDNNKSG